MLLLLMLLSILIYIIIGLVKVKKIIEKKHASLKQKRSNKALFKSLTFIEQKLVTSILNDSWKRSTKKDTYLISYSDTKKKKLKK